MKKLVLMLLMCAPMAVFAQTAPKFGHVDAMAIMQGLPEFIKARGEIEAQAKQYEDQMKEMQTEIQTKSEAYDKNQSTMNATAKAEAPLHSPGQGPKRPARPARPARKRKYVSYPRFKKLLHAKVRRPGVAELPPTRKKITQIGTISLQ